MSQDKMGSLRSASDLTFELKFTIDGRNTTAVHRWINSICKVDQEFPTNVVNSIYYDTPQLDQLREKVNSDYLKTKFRLRWYETNGNIDERSFLEAKFRIGPRRHKIRLETDFSGSWLTHLPMHDQALQLIPQKLRQVGVTVPNLLRAVMHIRYTRNRFIERLTGARISLDSCITTPAVNKELIPSRNPLPLHTAVVEIKGEETEIPLTLRNLKELGGRKAAFSKYYACYDHSVNGFHLTRVTEA